MALPRITQKEMTEREQRELKTLLDRARIAGNDSNLLIVFYVQIMPDDL
ncbi:DUF3811 domain-containing protein, partial [Shigella flexneri]